MDIDTLITTFRSEVDDVAEPHLWTDTDVYGYIDETQKMFCRLAVGISDSTSELTNVTFSAGDEYATYDPRILRLRMARLASDYRSLRIMNFEDFVEGGVGADDDYGLYTAQPTLDLRAGPVTILITNMTENAVRLVKIPEADDAILLTVYRMPLEDITESSTALEVDPKHHRSLLYGMKSLAYQKEDAETFDKARAAENETRFRMYCEQVKDEIARREHKVRVVAYGG